MGVHSPPAESPGPGARRAALVLSRIPRSTTTAPPLFVSTDKAIVDAVRRTAERRGVPMARIALAWVMRNPFVSAPIIGPTKVSHLDDAAAALEIDLTEDEISQVERHYGPRLPTYF